MEGSDQFLQIIQDTFFLTLYMSLQFFGGIFCFGLLLYLFARFTRNLFAKSFGSRAEVYITAWIGTPVHELGHAIFCILFLHKIRKISLFSPNSKDGSLGTVEHSYNSHNLYHRIGNFFIGAGPLFTGSFVILLLSFWLLPSGENFYLLINPAPFILSNDISVWGEFFGAYFRQAYQMIQMMFTLENAGTWQFWLFLYLSMAISTHMELSPPDLKQMWSGLLVILLLILLFNFFYQLFFSEFNNVLFSELSISTLLNRLLWIGLMFSGINFLFTWIITTLFGILFKREIPNPFTR